jgi:transposase
VRRELPRWHGIRPNLRIVRAVFAALIDPHGVTSHRVGALERTGLVLADWQYTTRRLADTEARMVAVLDELGLTELVTSIAGLTPVGAATILAETGDLTRFRSPRSVVKHAGLCPRDNSSGQHQGKSAISGRGRPALRLAAWRAVWAALSNNPVLAAKFTPTSPPATTTGSLANKPAPHALPPCCAGCTSSSPSASPGTLSSQPEDDH